MMATGSLVSPSPARTIGDLIQSRESVSADTLVGLVVQRFHEQADLDAVAVLDHGQIGLLTRTRLFLKLAQRFGFAVFERRPVRLVAEAALLVPSAADPVEVLHAAIHRSAEEIYDDLVIVDDTGYRGLVPMRHFLAHHKDLLLQSLGTIQELDLKLQEAEAARRHEERASQMRSRFFSHMSHELRTPLVTIRGLASLMADRTTDIVVQDTALRIEREARELIGTISNVLDAAKLEAGGIRLVLEDVDVGEVLARCVTRCEGLVGDKPVQLAVTIAPGLPRLRTDFVKLQQVFTNLLANACKFTEKGWVRIDARLQDDGVVVDVSDTGVGIPSEALARIWSPFEQADGRIERRFGGSGLGLSIVSGLVALLQGTITVQSELGVGTTFRVTLREISEETPESHSE
jgi:signal transduction histidine kinase